MKLERASVISHKKIYTDTYLMWLSCPALVKGATPGRFLMIHCGDGSDLLLPRPMSYHRFRMCNDDKQFAILYDVRGKGTSWLATRQPNDELEVFGPLGKGFTIKRSSQNLLLVAGGVGVAAMPALIDQALLEGKNIMLTQGARTASKLMPLELIPEEVEVASATDDGSVGYQGPVTNLFAEHLAWADQSFACGPTPMFEAMAKVIQEKDSRKSVQALLEERMGCGTAVCYGCAVFTQRGVKLVCKDGPCFELRHVFLK